MKKGLFINNRKAKDSIYESGYMVYQCLKLSDKYELDYCEVDVENREIKTGYDFYFFNYHPITMSWLQTRNLRKDLGFVITMILEVAPNDPYVLCPKGHFSLYCALDPTLRQKGKIYPFPRPLESISFSLPVIENKIPVIGSFGFATKGKGFQHVVEAVNKEFEQAVVRINIPYGDYVPHSKEYAIFLGELCRNKAKPGVKVIVTHEFMSKEDLIRWCAGNTLNCFMYDRNMPGLSATTDQAIVSGKPLSVSVNDTFRHITNYLPPYPAFSLKDSIEKSIPIVNKMKEDWAPEAFSKKFEDLLARTLPGVTVQNHSGNYLLPLKSGTLRDILEHRYKKYRRKLEKFSIKTLFSSNKTDEII